MEYVRLLSKYRFFRYFPADPLEACNHITKEIEYFNRGMGVSFFKRVHNFTNLPFIAGISCMALYFMCGILSAYWFRHEVTMIIFATATFGFGMQAMMKIHCFIFTRRRVVEFYEINLRYYQAMMRQSERVQECICQNASLTYILVKGTILIYLLLVIILVLLPAFSSIFLSNRMLPFGFILPFIDPDTLAGYIWNYVFQLICGYYYWMIAAGSDATTIYNLLAAYGQLDVLMMLIDEFDDRLDRDEPREVIWEKMVEITQLHQHHRSYLQQLVNFLNPYHLVTVGSTVSSMVISVLAVVLLDWYPGILVMFLGSIQIFYICFLGTGLEVKTDELTLKVGAIHWNKLSVSEMKHMKLVLALTQQPKAFLVATTPLNVTTFVQIHKLIYSMIMMLENTKD